MNRRTPLALGSAWLLILAAATGAIAQGSLYEIPYKGPRQVQDLMDRGVDIVAHTRDHVLHVVATPTQRSALSAHGVTPRLLQAFSDENPASIAAFTGAYANYRTYTEVVAALANLASTYPTLASVSVIGQSVEGRDIPVIKISDNVGTDEAEAEALIMGCHHARELMSVEQPLLFAEHLLSNYGSDPDVTAMVDEREIWIAPCVNPDGFVYVENNHGGASGLWWRKNRRDNLDGTFGIDLNRNYSYEWGSDVGSSGDTSSNLYRGPAPFSEPETVAIRDFVNSREFVIWLSYHSYGELLLYPWGYDYLYTTDHAIYKEMGERMTAANGYFPGNSAMGAIYLVSGSSDDWGWGDDSGRGRIYSFTPEVGSYADGGFGPPDTLIQPYFDDLLSMNMLAIEFAGNPAAVLGPTAPTIVSAGGTASNELVLTWTGNVPGDVNPAVTYAMQAVRNPDFVASIDAESVSPYVALHGGFVTSNARAYDGSNSHYSGMADNLNATVEMVAPWRVTVSHDEFTAWMWYDIEIDWDYGFVEVSTDQGLTWQSIAGNITTSTNPNGNNPGHGITGKSGGVDPPIWVLGSFPLSGYIGQEVLLRIRYATDAAVLEEGLYVDAFGPAPSFDSIDLLFSGVATTSYTFAPTNGDPYLYRVRGTDADGDTGDWSPLFEVDDPTSAHVVPPAHSVLGQNFPNPFNPVTAIPYAVGALHGNEAARRVDLAVYDVSGRRVKTLAAGLTSPGQYRAIWDGTDENGTRVGTGTYFARLSVDSQPLEARKLVLVK